MRLNHLVLFFCAIFFLCGFTSNKEAAQVFGNMTYYLRNEKHTEDVTLKNGKFYKRYCWDVFYDNRCVYGDFNHDGLRDAAVIIVVNYGGGNTNDYILAFLINDGHKLIHKASRYLDNWAIINSLKEKNGKVLVDMFVHQKGDCNAGPSKRVRNVYEYLGPEVFAFK